MHPFQLLAQPWWVNLLILIPVFTYFAFRRLGVELSRATLLAAALFAIAFGFVEASVVVYLRAATGLLRGYQGTLAEVQRQSHDTYQQSRSISEFPQSLLSVEVFREAATIVMLIAVAWLSAPRRRERWAVFLWTFAFWDIFYYVGLWATVRWPSSPKELDVLFLIPVPWVSQVWFPVLVSALTALAVGRSRR